MNKKGLLVVGILLIGLAISMFFGSSSDEVVDVEDLRESKLFEDYRYRFSLMYPSEMLVREYKEDENSITFVFEDIHTKEGFQIFITPYGEDHITNERFRMDVPSGVIEDVVEVIVGGERGVVFWSENALLGRTREVWVIHGGFIFEVTTFAHLDSQLSEIMSTWKFL